MRKVTIRDVAREAKVSIGTASRVINGVANVDPPYRRRVLEAVDKLGFIPNRAAQDIRRGRSQEIGIIVRDIAVPVLGGFVKAAQCVFEEAGYVLLVCSTENLKNRELDILRRFRQRRIEALLTGAAAEDDPELIEARAQLDVPLLMFDRECGSYDSVLIDYSEGTRQAVEYLLALGHRRILLITGQNKTHPARSRVEGYRAAYRTFGIKPSADMIRTVGFDADTGFRESMNALERPDKPTAIVAGGIDMLAGIIKAARARGQRIPDDISIIGGADSDLALLTEPAVTVLRWDYTEVGSICARMMLDRIGSADIALPRQVLITPELVLRGSCKPIVP